MGSRPGLELAANSHSGVKVDCLESMGYAYQKSQRRFV
jgi:hypothetical protein